MNFNRFAEPECEKFRQKCNFSNAERNIFDFLAKGHSRLEAAVALHMSVPTIDRRIRQIKQKIEKVQ